MIQTQEPPPPDVRADDGRWRWYQGIGGKLLIAFALIAALTVGSTWISVIRLREADGLMHRLTEVSLPAVKLSLGVDSAATEVAAAANNVGRAANEVERFRRMDALSEQIAQLWSALAQLQAIVPDVTTTARLQELTASIDATVGDINRATGELFALTDRRRRTADQIPAAVRRTLDLVHALTAGGDADAGLPALLRAAGDLRAEVGVTGALLQQIAAEETADEVAALRAPLEAARAELGRLVAALARAAAPADGRLEEIRAAIEALLALGEGERGLLATQQRFFVQLAEAGAQRQTLRAAEEGLRKQVATLVAEAERDARATTDLSARSIANSLIWLILITATSLLIATLIVWKFVLRYVVSRLSHFAETMMAIARGDLSAPIPAAGRDELGDMGRALAVFRDNAREIRAARQEAEDARREAEAASRTKSAFLANMSHELRTPLNAIIGYSELLVEDAADRSDTAGVEDLQKIQGAGKHLLGLINGILDLSKIEAGRMDVYLEQVYLSGLIDDVRAIVDPLMAKNANTLLIDCPTDIGSMRTDPVKLKQSLINLLSNAAKFTNQGTVRFAVSRSDGGDGRARLTFRVADSGIGMTEVQIGRLFQAFSQADSSTTRNYGGTGLGLTITRHFAVMLGGSVDVTSEPGAGSTFTLILPDQSPTTTSVDGPLDAESGATNGATNGATVLVVDDDPTVHEVLTPALAREGYRVQHARDGAEALDMMRKSPPDVVTLDVMMPKVDGWSVLGRMKSDPELEHIPVIMVTIVDDRNLGYSLGASEFMIKPIDRIRLVTMVRRFTQKESDAPVLIVDDDADVRDVARTTLQAAGLRTAEATNGRAALDWLDEHPRPALILLDLMMPVMDGFELLEQVRAHSAWRDIPVVVLTAKELTDEERTVLAERTVLVLSKSAQPIGALGTALAAICRRPAPR